MNRMSCFVIALGALGLQPVAHARSFQYAHDDGAGLVNIGPVFDGQLLWGNYFFAQPGAAWITTISVAFGNIAPGRDVTLLLFEDPDDDADPSNAQLLTTASGLTALPQSNAYIDFAITPTEVSGGFFVAALMSYSAGEAPARLDESTNSGFSWIAADGVIDPDDLSGSFIWFNMQNNAIPGTWMVRATGKPVPAPGWALALAALLPAAQRRRRAPQD